MLSQTSPPTTRPLAWETEAKQHLRLDSDEERARIETILVPAAMQFAEAETGRQIITASWTLYLDTFPATGVPIELPKPPLSSVTSVKYYDTAGVLQTWSAANYSVKAPAGPYALPGRIIPAYGVTYPSTYSQPSAVQILFVAGYGSTPESVPGLLKAAMLLIVGEMFERRETGAAGSISEIPMGARRLLFPFRVWQ